MPSRRKGSAQPPPLAELCPDEDVDPRLPFDGPGRLRKRISKSMQLCRQVERALVLALADERREAVLASVALDAVEPAPDASRLKVTVRVPVSPGDRAALGEARAALSRRRAHLREEVARSVHRKRAPELTFEVWPAEDGGE